MKKQPALDPMMISEKEFSERVQAYLQKLKQMPKAKFKALLVGWGTLNPDGSVPAYPMDHVPYGPRE